MKKSVNKILFIGMIQNVANFIYANFEPDNSYPFRVGYNYDRCQGFYVYDRKGHTLNGEKFTTRTYTNYYNNIESELTISCGCEVKYSFRKIEARKNEKLFDELKEQFEDIDLIVLCKNNSYGYDSFKTCSEVILNYVIAKAISKEYNIPLSFLDFKDSDAGENQLKQLEINFDASTELVLLGINYLNRFEINYFTEQIPTFKEVVLKDLENIISNGFSFSLDSLNNALKTKYTGNNFVPYSFSREYGSNFCFLKDLLSGDELIDTTIKLTNEQIKFFESISEKTRNKAFPTLFKIVEENKRTEERDKALIEIVSIELDEFLKVSNSFKALQTFSSLRTTTSNFKDIDSVYNAIKNKYSKKLTDKVIKILNRNRNNKDVPSLIKDKLQPLFGDIIDFYSLDPVIIQTVFPEKIKNTTKYSDIIIRDLDPNLRIANSVESPASVFMLINLLDKKDFEKELPVLAPAMYKWISNKYTSKYNYDWNSYNLCRSYILDSNSQIINKENWTKLLIEIFKIVENTNSDFEMKKFISFGIQGKMELLDLVTESKELKESLRFKRINMERKFE